MVEEKPTDPPEVKTSHLVAAICIGLLRTRYPDNDSATYARWLGAKQQSHVAAWEKKQRAMPRQILAKVVGLCAVEDGVREQLIVKLKSSVNPEKITAALATHLASRLLLDKIVGEELSVQLGAKVINESVILSLLLPLLKDDPEVLRRQKDNAILGAGVGAAGGGLSTIALVTAALTGPIGWLAILVGATGGAIAGAAMVSNGTDAHRVGRALTDEIINSLLEYVPLTSSAETEKKGAN